MVNYYCSIYNLCPNLNNYVFQPQEYLETIANFIVKNSGGAAQFQLGESCDPLTGTYRIRTSRLIAILAVSISIVAVLKVITIQISIRWKRIRFRFWRNSSFIIYKWPWRFRSFHRLDIQYFLINRVPSENISKIIF